MSSAFAKIVTQTEPRDVKPLKGGMTGALIATYGGGVRAVLKPAKEKLPNGNKRQRGIPVSSQPKREVAFYELAKLCGYEAIVPETVLTEVKGAECSAQVFHPGAVHLHDVNPALKVKDDKDEWKSQLKATCRIVPKDSWRQMLALDIIAGARDRHAHNVGVVVSLRDDKPTYKLLAWDNACTFGLTFRRYHNVFHKLLFRKAVNFDPIWPTWERLTLETLQRVLGSYLTEEEVVHAYLRKQFFEEYPYRLPWKVCSQGHDGSKEFPEYAVHFQPVIEQPTHLVALSA